LRRILTIKETRIKYLLAEDKLYEIEKLSFYTFSIVAKETDLTAADVPKEEIFLITDFIKDFHVKLRNWKGNLVKFEDFVKNEKVVP